MSVRCIVGPGFESSTEQWCRGLPQRIRHGINSESMLHQARNVVFEDRLDDGTAVVVKWFGRSFSSLTVDSWRGSKAQRSFDIAETMCAHTIATPAPIAWIEWRCGPCIIRSAYISQAIDSALQLRWYLRKDEGAYQPEAIERRAAAGALLATMHQAGIWHRDLSPGNLIWGPGHKQLPTWHLVDLNRTDLRTVPDASTGAAGLARIGAGHCSFLLDILRGYAATWNAPLTQVIAGWATGRREWLQQSQLQRRSRQGRRRLMKRLRA